MATICRADSGSHVGGVVLDDRPVIAFDCDDTLIDLRTPMMRTLNAATGRHIHWRDWSDYVVPHRYGLSLNAFCAVLLRERVLERAQLEPDAVQEVNRVRREGFRIEVWTARGFHDDGLGLTARQVAPLGIAQDAIRIFALGESKARAVADRPEVWALVDDSPDHAAELADLGLSDRIVMPARPWNATTRGARFESLNDIATYIGHLDRSHGCSAQS